MEEYYFKERRQFVRIKTNLTARFIDSYKIEGRGFVNDVSAQGLGLFMHQYLKPQTTIELWIELPSQQKTVYLKGEVVWSKTIDFSNYRVGVQSDHVDLASLTGFLDK
ncbi:MAG: PilZ domain-containing protein [Candidatus Omnitrophica bacterium]|nr:PilZ domain-containing protein [Candidatus Omnitrophota bacterium]